MVETIAGAGPGGSAARGRRVLAVAGRGLRRPGPAVLVVLACYALLSLAMDPSGSLGTDTGGKVATLEVMGERGTLDVDVGYWAAARDPEADLHGLYHTARIGDRYVNVTTLPMVVAARPLHELGGYRLALALPMAGSLGAAWGARALARRAARGGEGEGAPWWGDGWAAFWVVALASPLTVYALDLWEHSIGVAMSVAAVVVLVDVAASDRPPGRAVLAGLLLGGAASMRTEAVVYAVACVGVAVVVLAVAGPRGRRSAVVAGATAVAGFLAAVGLATLVEVAMLGEPLRTGRATSAAGSGARDLGDRSAEAVITTAAFLAEGADGRLPLYLGFAVALVAAVALASRPGRSRWALLPAGVVAAAYAWAFADGPRWVPGFLAAAPFAGAGLVLAWSRPRARLAAAMALAALPLVWAFQYSGGAVPQWGGRYVLTTATVLVAVGVARAPALVPWARWALVGASVAVTAVGLVWLAERSHEVARSGREVAARPEPVVVSGVEFWLRELGPHYPGSRWLTVEDGEEGAAAALLAAEDVDRFAFLDFARVRLPDFPGYRPGERVETEWMGTRFAFTAFEAVEDVEDEPAGVPPGDGAAAPGPTGAGSPGP
jgi:hypothetical protein